EIDRKDAGTLKWLRSAKTRAAVENMARENCRYAAVPEQWDSNLLLSNTPGGACDLHTCDLREHRLEDYCTKMTAVAPKNAECPLWMSFLTRITGGDAELQRYMQR